MALRADDIDLNRDRLLVEAWQAGDAAAFDELYRRYFDRLRSFCRRKVGDAAEAEELAQEAFVKALQALPRFDGERRFYPWMTVIASRLCIDHHRRRARVEPTDEVDLGSVDDGHDARFSMLADLDHLDRAMRKLGPRHAEVLDMRERRGMTYHEIAAELGVPHSTVEALLFRARKALRREFHLVAGERLAAIPGVGWLLNRFLRTRDRLALLGPDLPAVGGAVAAGAVAAALVVLPGVVGGPAAPVTVRAAAAPAAAAAIPAALPPLPSLPEPATPAEAAPETDEPAPTTAPPIAVRPVTGGEAAESAATMPVQVALGDSGIGVDLTPLASKLASAPSGRTRP